MEGSFHIAALLLVFSCFTTKQGDCCTVCGPPKMIDKEKQLVLVGVCLTELGDNSTVAVYGYCPYFTVNETEVLGVNYIWYYHINFSSHLTEQTCGPLNRKGLLCSECYEGYGPAVHAFSNMCIKCEGSAYGRWALYLFVALFPITVFYFIIIIFNVNAASPPFKAYILFCQTFAIMERMYFPSSPGVNIHDRSQALLLLARTISGVWNLDFGRYLIPPFCVTENLSTYHALFLDYILGLYPMVLIFFTYVAVELHANNFKLVVLAWRPFHRCFTTARRTWDPRASIVNAFATFVLLSLTKNLFVSSYPFQKETISGLSTATTYNHLFYNPNIAVHSHDNLPFIAVSISVTVMFTVVSVVLLCCYQEKLFRRALVFFCCQRQDIVSMFFDVYQGHYKDGTEGTYDLRFLSGLYPLFSIVFIWNVCKHSIESHPVCRDQLFYCFVVTVVTAFARPYKRFNHNLTETLLLILTTIMVWRCHDFVISDYLHSSRIKLALLQLIPHSLLALMIIFKVSRLLLQRIEQLRYCNCHHMTQNLNKLPWLVWLVNTCRKFIKATTGLETQPLIPNEFSMEFYRTT